MKYSRSFTGEDDGMQKLQREIISGEGPDIIDFGQNYAKSDVIGKYTEDLFPYIVSEKNDYFENILNSFSLNDHLYAIPISFTLDSLVSTTSIVNDMKSWNTQEMIETYNIQKELSNEIYLYPGETKLAVFGAITAGSIDYYVNWNTGECKFNETDFQNILKFANTFPETLKITDDFSPKEIFATGRAILYPSHITNFYSTAKIDQIFKNQEVVYIGFPVENNTGTIINASKNILAISALSKNKEVAWDFISEVLSEEYQDGITESFPIRKSSFYKLLSNAKMIEYELSEDISKYNNYIYC